LHNENKKPRQFHIWALKRQALFKIPSTTDTIIVVVLIVVVLIDIAWIVIVEILVPCVVVVVLRRTPISIKVFL